MSAFPSKRLYFRHHQHITNGSNSHSVIRSIRSSRQRTVTLHRAQVRSMKQLQGQKNSSKSCPIATTAGHQSLRRSSVTAFFFKALAVLAMTTAMAALPAAAATTFITVHVNSPACWYKPAFASQRSGLDDADLLANSYDTIVAIRESNELTGQVQPGNVGHPRPTPDSSNNRTGPMPPGTSNGFKPNGFPSFQPSPAWCLLNSDSWSYYQFDSGNSNLLRYTNCTDSYCSNGCILAASAAYPPPTTNNYYASDSCNGLMYKIANSSGTPEPLPSLDAYSRFMVSTAFTASRLSAPCTGTPRSTNIVKIYDKCTQISVPGAPLQYAISTVLDQQVSHKLCRDDTCITCVTSTTIAPWTRSEECSEHGPIATKGLYFPMDVSTSNQTNNANASTATDTSSNPFTTPVIFAVIASAIALLIMVSLLIHCLVTRNKNKNSDHERHIQSQSQAAAVPPRIATIVANPADAHGNSVYGANHHSSTQYNDFSASKVVQILEQPHTVVVNYEPQMTDEIRLTIGDQVILESVWSDGWAQAYNITSGERGTLAIATLDGTLHAAASSSVQSNSQIGTPAT
ncbi:hypothetical protein QVD99_004936 [Batrachochytrium dendrobatidis]|nr:hypothetical protein O5D80_004621 [Batrachochytrium dendrobatidis]KAK5667885.1 hypothetical protein QVD99_004936 [Batrachochytrium dendrobatidis]